MLNGINFGHWKDVLMFFVFVFCAFSITIFSLFLHVRLLQSWIYANNVFLVPPIKLLLLHAKTETVGWHWKVLTSKIQAFQWRFSFFNAKLKSLRLSSILFAHMSARKFATRQLRHNATVQLKFTTTWADWYASAIQSKSWNYFIHMQMLKCSLPTLQLAEWITSQ